MFKSKWACFVVFATVLGWCAIAAEPRESGRTAAAISAILEADAHLQGVPFGDIILGATGQRVLPLDPTNAPDRELLGKIGAALDQVLRELNRTNHPAHAERRINEVSAHFEKAIRTALNSVPGFECDYPRTAAGRVQRAGYPDLRLVEQESGRVFYLDPKLFERGNRNSTLRTFYYEPKRETSKVLEDAHHLLIGIEHAGKTDGHWQFLGWDMVDLSRFKLRLKAEFQGSNRDLYQPETIVGSSSR